MSKSVASIDWTMGFSYTNHQVIMCFLARESLPLHLKNMIVQTTDDVPEDRAVEVLDVGLERPRAQHSCLLSQKS